MQCFHNHRGNNIVLFDDQTVANRQSSFAHGITFSERPLHPMELFLVQIEKTERGWSGHLRIGLTQINPDNHISLPQYALPDLTNIDGKNSWIFAVRKSHQVSPQLQRDGINTSNDLNKSTNSSDFKSILGDEDFVYTYRGHFHKSILRSLPRLHLSSSASTEEPENVLPTDVGSRIGILYVTRGDKADMHFILNGEDQGPRVTDIPYKQEPLYAVIDVYGTTKQVRIVQLSCVGILQALCRDVILCYTNRESIPNLPIPNKIKDYLLDGCVYTRLLQKK